MGCSICGSVSNLEIPQPVALIYLFCLAKSRFTRVLELSLGFTPGDLCRRHCQVGSLAGAAHLLNDNAGVPR
jgi:hypothetical protein